MRVLMFKSGIDEGVRLPSWQGGCAVVSGQRSGCVPAKVAGLTGYLRVSSFIALNMGPVTAFARTPTDQTRADAERLSHIILEMQRCFLLHLSKELAPGNVSFPQFFLLAYLDQKEMLTMSA